MSRDVYARVLAEQNDGVPCPYCDSGCGHFSHCALLNGGVDETPFPEIPSLTHAEFERWDDNLFLHDLGVAGL